MTGAGVIESGPAFHTEGHLGSNAAYLPCDLVPVTHPDGSPSSGSREAPDPVCAEPL